MVQLVDPLQDAEWDQKITAFPDATIFHTTAWARVLRDTYGFQPHYFVISKGDDFECIVPTMEVSSWLTGRRGVSLPFTDACAPLGVSEANRVDTMRMIHAHARQRRWKYFEARDSVTLSPDAAASSVYLNHRLPLGIGESSLFSRFDGAVRQAIRKAQRSDFVIDFADSQTALRDFYALMCKTRQRHGVPPQPFRFFENISRHLLKAKKGCIVLARLAGKAVAGAVFFHFNRIALYKFGASDEAYQNLRANNLVMWHAITRFAGDGYCELDFGRTSAENEGLRRFKLGWGTTEHALPYARYDYVRSRFVSNADASRGWHTELIRRLPSSLSRLIGSALYRHVA